MRKTNLVPELMRWQRGCRLTQGQWRPPCLSLLNFPMTHASSVHSCSSYYQRFLFLSPAQGRKLVSSHSLLFHAWKERTPHPRSEENEPSQSIWKGFGRALTQRSLNFSQIYHCNPQFIEGNQIIQNRGFCPRICPQLMKASSEAQKPPPVSKHMYKGD